MVAARVAERRSKKKVEIEEGNDRLSSLTLKASRWEDEFTLERRKLQCYMRCTFVSR